MTNIFEKWLTERQTNTEPITVAEAWQAGVKALADTLENDGYMIVKKGYSDAVDQFVKGVNEYIDFNKDHYETMSKILNTENKSSEESKPRKWFQRRK